MTRATVDANRLAIAYRGALSRNTHESGTVRVAPSVSVARCDGGTERAQVREPDAQCRSA